MNADSDLNMNLDSDTNNEKNQKAQRLVVIVLLILGCVVLSVVGCFAGLFWLGSQTPENISVVIDVPSIVEVGQEIALSVSITNTGAEPLELNSIDIDTSYLDGFVVGTVTPPYEEVDLFDSVDDSPYQTYTFLKTIQPDETLVIEFTLTALQTGDYDGGLDICIDSGFNCRQDIVRTIIK